jgi:alpha-D-xyloside xylohydrolase
MPVLVRAGALLVTQPAAAHTTAAPAHHLILSAYPGRRGAFTLYDDAGTGFGYEQRAFTRTRITQRRTARRVTVSFGAPRGRFPGGLAHRRWTLRLLGMPKRPRRVLVNGRRRAFGYTDGIATVELTVRGVARVVAG